MTRGDVNEIRLLVAGASLMALACSGGEHKPTPTSPPGPAPSVSTGTLRFIIRTIGTADDTSGFTVVIGGQTIAISIGDSVATATLSPGVVSVSLSGVDEHCRSVGMLPDATVQAGLTTTVVAQIECAGQLTFSEQTGIVSANIWILDQHGGRRQLTHGAGSQVPVQWYHDGSRLVFTSGSRWLTVARDGSDERPLLPLDPNAKLSDVSISPDDRTLVFVRPTLVDGTSQVRVAGISGTNERPLLPPGSYDFAPTWSPDGRRIALFTNRWGGWGEIADVTPEGTDIRLLAQTGPSATGPLRWSPDGRWLAYATWNEVGRHLQLVSAAGGTTQALWPEASIGTFWWTPESTRLTLTIRAGDAWRLATVDTSGASRVELTSGEAASCIAPSWTADARWVAYECDGIVDGKRVQYLAVAPPDGSNPMRILGGTALRHLGFWLPAARSK